MLDISLSGLWVSIITLFVIMDPVASIPAYIAMTKSFSEEDASWTSKQAVLIAGALAAGFMFIGPLALGFMGITLDDFRVAGGLILGLLGVEMVLGITFAESKESGSQTSKGARSAIATLIATPMLTGPGLMSSTVLLSRQYGYATVVIGLFPVLLVSYVFLHNAGRIKKILGEQALEVTSRLMGLLLVALAVSFIRAGILA